MSTAHGSKGVVACSRCSPCAEPDSGRSIVKTSRRCHFANNSVSSATSFAICAPIAGGWSRFVCLDES